MQRVQEAIAGVTALGGRGKIGAPLAALYHGGAGEGLREKPESLGPRDGEQIDRPTRTVGRGAQRFTGGPERIAVLVDECEEALQWVRRQTPAIERGDDGVV
ncbi:MAG: hypothetical protein VW935_15245 [Novosphingobium sp.]